MKNKGKVVFYICPKCEIRYFKNLKKCPKCKTKLISVDYLDEGVKDFQRPETARGREEF